MGSSWLGAAERFQFAQVDGAAVLGDDDIPSDVAFQADAFHANGLRILALSNGPIAAQVSGLGVFWFGFVEVGHGLAS